MTEQQAERQAAPRVRTRGGDDTLRGTETKAAFKTTELIVYVFEYGWNENIR